MNQISARRTVKAPTFRQVNIVLTIIAFVLTVGIARAAPSQYTANLKVPGALLLFALESFLFWLFIVYSTPIYNKESESARVYFLWIVSSLVLLGIPLELHSQVLAIVILYVSSFGFYLLNRSLHSKESELSKENQNSNH